MWLIKWDLHLADSLEDAKIKVNYEPVNYGQVFITLLLIILQVNFIWHINCTYGFKNLYFCKTHSTLKTSTMKRRNLLTVVLLVAWGIFSVNAQTVQTDQDKESKTVIKKVINPSTDTKKGATPATPAVPAKQTTPTAAKKGATPAKPAVPANQSGKQTGTAKPATGNVKPNIKPVTPVKPGVVAKDLTGLWITAQKATIVEFYKVGDKYNGKAVWSKQKDKSGKPLKDVNNPDRAKRNNPIVGTDLITGLTYNAKTDTYEGGRIYQPQTGKSFNCKVKLDKNKNAINITGGSGFISKTLTWTRTTGVPGK